MKILIDADGCPVVDITVKVAKEHNIECIIIADTSHIFDKYDAKIITVEKGADSVDFRLVNEVGENDIVVTQDYGLAAICLAKKAVVLNQNGVIYDDSNINTLLDIRYISKKYRMSGGRTKGPSKRTSVQDEKFKNKLCYLIKNA